MTSIWHKMLQFVQFLTVLVNIWPPDDPVISKIQQLLADVAVPDVAHSDDISYRLYTYYGTQICKPTDAFRLSGL